MLGHYPNFPEIIQHTETFAVAFSRRNLQQKIVQVFAELNAQSFSFEEAANPTVPNCSVIFEFGIADQDGFTFLTAAEAKRLHKVLEAGSPAFLDWFVGIRYYKNTKPKKTPLKFDYYMLRLAFSEKGVVEFQVHHNHGPRYISPADLLAFAVAKINKSDKHKLLKAVKPRQHN
jgi:hypothetical protein